MKRLGWMLAIAVACVAAPATAQFLSDAENLVKAVRDRDGSTVTDILNARGASVVNRRNNSGETALIVAISERDDGFTRFLLNRGADPNLASGEGVTPLIAAARIGFTDAVEWLIAKGAQVDGTNRMGETPLIVAVQQRHAPIVKMLLEKGADPDRADAAAGYSARDYAKRDSRARNILELFERAKPKTVTMENYKLR